jgi:hypothetical protein
MVALNVPYMADNIITTFHALLSEKYTMYMHSALAYTVGTSVNAYGDVNITATSYKYTCIRAPLLSAQHSCHCCSLRLHCG